MPVLVTDNAIREIAHIVKQQGLDPATVRLRVGVKGGGCSGFSYILDLTETEKETDEGWDYTVNLSGAPAGATAVKAGSCGSGCGCGSAQAATPAVGDAAEPCGEGETFTLRVICDPKSHLYIDGTTVDFRDEIMGRGFVFNNPNATTTCGCGSSFSA